MMSLALTATLKIYVLVEVRYRYWGALMNGNDRLRIQPIDATNWLNRWAGVS